MITCDFCKKVTKINCGNISIATHYVPEKKDMCEECADLVDKAIKEINEKYGSMINEEILNFINSLIK